MGALEILFIIIIIIIIIIIVLPFARMAVPFERSHGPGFFPPAGYRLMRPLADHWWLHARSAPRCLGSERALQSSASLSVSGLSTWLSAQPAESSSIHLYDG